MLPLALMSGLVIVGIGTIMVASGAAEGETDAAAQALSALSKDGPDQVPVATVNGVPISSTTLQVHVATASLVGVESKSKRELLDDLIDAKLLTQAAVKAGVQVTDDEVDGAIRAGILDPLNAKTTPDDIRRVIVEALRAQGVTPETALENAGVRTAYAGMVLRGRYLRQARSSEDDMLPALRKEADIRVFLDGR